MARKLKAKNGTEAPKAKAPKAKGVAVKRGRPATPSPYDNFGPDQLKTEQKSILEMGVNQADALAKEMNVVASIRSGIGKLKDRFVKCGGEKEDYDWFMKARLREPSEIDAETRRRNRIAQLMSLPIGTQLGMFDTGETVATATENATANQTKGIVDADDLAAARAEGEVAGLSGEPAESVPYEEGSPLEVHWTAGREYGLKQRATAAEMGQETVATA